MKLPVATSLDLAFAGLAVFVLGAVGQMARSSTEYIDQAHVATAAPAPSPSVTPAPRWATFEALLADQARALTDGNAEGLIHELVPNAIGFGANATDYGDGASALSAFIRHDLRGPAEILATQRGRVDQLAWVARTVTIDGKQYAITQVATVVHGSWAIVASHWAALASNGEVSRAARAGTLPPLATIPPDVDAPSTTELLHSAFGSTGGHADAFSSRDDAIHVGSTPGEWLVSGPVVKRWWRRSSATLSLSGGLRVVSEGAWNPARVGDPSVAVAFLNAELHNSSGLVTPYRVLAVLSRDGADWAIVATQWSIGGPVPKAPPTARATTHSTDATPDEVEGGDPAVRADGSDASGNPGQDRLEQAQDAYAAGDFAAAKRAAEQALAFGAPGASLLAAMATCKVGDVDAARKRAAKLRGSELARFQTACPNTAAKPSTHPEVVDPFDDTGGIASP